MPDSPSKIFVYHPCPVKLPAHLGWQRDIRTRDREIEVRNLSFDRDTLFYDVFRNHDHRKIIALGPDLRNLGARVLPLRVYCRGRRLRCRSNMRISRKHALWYWDGLSILEIFADEEDLVSDEPLELVFRWKSFEQRVVVPPNPLAALPPAALTLYTLQKDNRLQWLRDWCLYYHRVHGVERVVIYDNGSAAAARPEHLAGLDAGLEVIVVDWDFPYGNHANQYCQYGSLNHCPRIFGEPLAYYLNFDVDEYLVNHTSQPLVRYLEQHLTGGVASLQVPEIPIPDITQDGSRPAGVYDFNVRYRSTMPDGDSESWCLGEKTIFQHQGTARAYPHSCRSHQSKIWSFIVQRMVLWTWLQRNFKAQLLCLRFLKPLFGSMGLRYPEKCTQSNLCYRHYRGLFTGWKEADHPARHSVVFDPAIHETDTEMQQLFEKHGIGR